MKMLANKNNIRKWIERLSKFNETPECGITRIMFTESEIKSRDYIKAEMTKLGLSLSEDSIGNIYAVLKGEDENLAPVWTGSHIDTVPNAGNFDGVAGVVCGLEAIRIIKEGKLPHKRNITLIVYTSEEPIRFKHGCLGSRAMSGDLNIEETKNMIDENGETLFHLLNRIGYDTSKFSDIKKNKGDVYASVELHIEQNNQLEKAGVPIGIVKKICAPSNYMVEITGCQAHAGGASMENRKDAFAACGEISIFLEKLANECRSEYNTVTIGFVDVVPNAVNVIPGKVRFSIDIRDCNWDTKQQLIKEMIQGIQEIGDRRKVCIQIKEENNDIPLTCNENILNKIERNCDDMGVKYKELISGPYHDSLFVGRFAPTAMIFVPSKNGISHSPEEWTDYEDLLIGTEALQRTLLQLANSEEEIL